MENSWLFQGNSQSIEKNGGFQRKIGQNMNKHDGCSISIVICWRLASNGFPFALSTESPGQLADPYPPTHAASKCCSRSSSTWYETLQFSGFGRKIHELNPIINHPSLGFLGFTTFIHYLHMLLLKSLSTPMYPHFPTLASSFWRMCWFTTSRSTWWPWCHSAEIQIWKQRNMSYVPYHTSECV